MRSTSSRAVRSWAAELTGARTIQTVSAQVMKRASPFMTLSSTDSDGRARYGPAGKAIQCGTMTGRQETGVVGLARRAAKGGRTEAGRVRKPIPDVVVGWYRLRGLDQANCDPRWR